MMIKNQSLQAFTLLMWGQIKKTVESENHINRGYFSSTKGQGNRIEL